MKETLRKQKLFFISLIGIVVVSLVMGTTFAYQTIKINGESERVLVLESGVLDVAYKRTNLINNSNMPLLTSYKFSSDYSEFTIDNTKSSEDVAFKIGIDSINYGYLDENGTEVNGCRTATNEVQAACIIDESFKYIIVELVDDDEIIKTEGDFGELVTNEVELTDYLKIEKGVTKTFRLYLWFNETNENQNHLENTYFKGKINITSIFFEDLVNPYDNNANSLAYNIINNAKNVTEEEKSLGYAEFRKTPLTKVAEEISSYVKDGVTYHENTLSIAEDDYTKISGFDSYYFRGPVKNNYVNFAGMCWRIVRIDGKGNTKLILEDQDDECKVSDGNWNIPASDGESITMNGEEPEYLGTYGFERNNGGVIANYLNPGEENADIAMVNAFKYFQTILNTNISNKYLNKPTSDYLISGNWCLENKFNINPTLKCNGTIMNTYNDETPMYVATLTVDEIVYAGVVEDGINEYFYLINDYSVENRPTFWTLTLSGSSSGHILFGDGEHFIDGISLGGYGFRPAILLKAGVEIVGGGIGTKDNPYVIK